MPDPTTAETSDRSSAPLYTWWLDAIPAMLGASAVPSGANAAASAWASAKDAPASIQPMMQALATTQQLLGALYTQVLGALAANPQRDPLDTLSGVVRQRVEGVRDLFAKAGQALSVQRDLTSSVERWTHAPAMLFADALAPVSTNLERAYGGLADAFGFAPTRELQEALRILAAASLARRQAQAEYLAIVGGALAAGAESLIEQLGQKAQRGEPVDSLLGLVRLWARATDGAMHRAMQDPKALEASAKLIRSATNAQRALHQVVSIVSRAFNVPTRSEVDDAYREIQELKREVRRLRKSVAPQLREPAANGAAVAGSPAKARKVRATGRNGGRSARGTNTKAVTE